MAKKTFSGGVHPDDKKISANSPIEILSAPERVFIPLSQHIGVPSELIVKKGDQVKLGQKIAEAKGFVSVPQHASVSGTVEDIRDVMTPIGKYIKSVVILNDGTDTWEEGKNIQRDYSKFTKDEMLNIIREAGIVGLGGAAFPTAVKLSIPQDKKAEFLIVNGAECEPYLTADHRLLLECSDKLIKGIEIVLSIIGAEKAFIGIEDNKEDAIKLLEDILKNNNKIEVQPLKLKYPQGDEKMIIKAITNREVPSGGLPIDIGVVVQNVGTIVAIYEAIAYNKPLIERVVTVTGGAIEKPSNFMVRIGTMFSELIDKARGYKHPPKKLINGGPMMGISVYTSQVPVMKGTSGVLAMTENETDLQDESPCIRCAKCVDVCPVNLLPTKMASLVDKRRFDLLESYNIMDCRECGSCAFTCPSKISLVHLIKFGKMELRKIQSANKK